ncbi:hypothetical protein JCM11251_005973 [Rhodosporidiobolus azoricus]
MTPAKAGLSKRSAGVRRLLQEAAELAADDEPSYTAAPLEDDLFSWHYTIKVGASDFEGGVYHGKMVLPSEYPFKPPEVYMLTPSGRFEVNKKICLSISSFHPETWQPSWGIRTALLALMAFFETEPKGAVGSLDAPPAERKRLAAASHTFKCSTCGYDAADAASFAALPPPPAIEPKADGTGEVESEKKDEKEEAIEVKLSAQPGLEVLGSEVSTPSLSPRPPESDDGEPELDAEESAATSIPPTTIFPAATGPRPSAASSAVRSPLSPRHRASAPSPSRAPPPPPLSHHVHHRSAAAMPPPLTAPGAPRLSPAHLPPSPSPFAQSAAPNPLRAAAAAAPPPETGLGQREEAGQQVVLPALPPGVTLAQASLGATGGPPQWVDRAILAVLLAIVALVVRKVA